MSRPGTVFFILLVFFLFVFSAFRFEVGTDYNHYVMLFNYLGEGNEHWGRIEPGFQILVKSIYIFTDNPRFLFFLFSLVTIVFFVIGWVRFSPSVIVSLIVFFGLYHYFNSLNVSRQYVAMSVYFLFATRGLIDKRPVYYFLSCFIASLFHLTAILMTVLYPFLVRRWSTYVYLLIYSLFIFIYLAYDYVSGFVFSSLGFYSGYLSYKEGSANILFITCLFMFGISWFYKSKIFKYGEIGVVAFNFSFLSVCIIPFSNYNIMFSRVAMYFSVYFAIVIPILLFCIKSKKERSVLFLMFLIVLVFNVFFHLYNNVGGVFPYSISL